MRGQWSRNGGTTPLEVQPITWAKPEIPPPANSWTRAGWLLSLIDFEFFDKWEGGAKLNRLAHLRWKNMHYLVCNVVGCMQQWSQITRSVLRNNHTKLLGVPESWRCASIHTVASRHEPVVWRYRLSHQLSVIRLLVWASQCPSHRFYTVQRYRVVLITNVGIDNRRPLVSHAEVRMKWKRRSRHKPFLTQGG